MPKTASAAFIDQAHQPKESQSLTPRVFADVGKIRLSDVVLSATTLEPSVFDPLQRRLEVIQGDKTGAELMQKIVSNLQVFLDQYQVYLKPVIAVEESDVTQHYLRETLRYILEHGSVNHAIDKPGSDYVKIYLQDAINMALQHMQDWFDVKQALGDGISIVSIVRNFREKRNI